VERYSFNAYKRTSKGKEMKLTFEQMDEILSKKLIEFCTPSEKKQIQKYACRTCINAETLFNISESIQKEKKRSNKSEVR
jgi:hypothetical protein